MLILNTRLPSQNPFARVIIFRMINVCYWTGKGRLVCRYMRKTTFPIGGDGHCMASGIWSFDITSSLRACLIFVNDNVIGLLRSKAHLIYTIGDVLPDFLPGDAFLVILNVKGRMICNRPEDSINIWINTSDVRKGVRTFHQQSGLRL